MCLENKASLQRVADLEAFSSSLEVEQKGERIH